MLKIIVLEGDETGQELLDEALRVLDPEVIGLELELDRHDLSLEKRRETDNEIVEQAAAAMRAGIAAAEAEPPADIGLLFENALADPPESFAHDLAELRRILGG